MTTTDTLAPPPSLTAWLDLLAAAARGVLRDYGLADASVHLIELKKNASYRVESASGDERFFLRLSLPEDFSPPALRSELLWLRHLDDAGVRVAAPIATTDGELLRPLLIEALEEQRFATLFRWLPGRQLDSSKVTPGVMRRIGELLGRLHHVAADFQPPADFERPRRDARQWFGDGEVIPAGRGEPLIQARHRRMIDSAAALVRRRLEGIGTGPETYGLTHTDLEPDNILDDGEGLYPIDFADCGWSYYLYDVAASLLPMAGRPDFATLQTAFVDGYRRVRPLAADQLDEIETFLVARSLFSMRLITRDYWDDPRRRSYAVSLFPYILGQVAGFLAQHRDGTKPGRQTGDLPLSTVGFLDRLRQLGIQLRAEDGKLKLSAPKGALTPELRDELKDRKAEILEFLERAKAQADPGRARRIPRVSEPGPYPLSFAQQRLWLIQQMQPESSVYNLFAGVRMRGTLDPAALAATVNALVARHESLRTTFTQVGQEPRQVIAPATARELPIVDLQSLPEAARRREQRRLLHRDLKTPFDLERGPLLRVRLIRMTPLEHVLMMVMHHVISDGWSTGVLVRELSILYAGFARGQDPRLPPLDVRYVDFAHWQRQRLDVEQQLAYWRRRLAGIPEALDLPTDRPRQAVRRDSGAGSARHLDRRLRDDLQLLAQRSDATLFMILLAAYQLLLSRQSGQLDLAVGSPIANRNHAQLEGLIGFFVNTLVLRADLDGDPSFLELLARVRRTTLEAYDHQNLPFERLVEDLSPGRSTAHTPLFQVFFVLQNTPRAELEMAGLKLEPVPIERRTTQFDLILSAQETEDSLRLGLRFSTDLFDRSTAQRYLVQLETLLRSILANPASRLSQLATLSPVEHHQLLVEWNDTATLTSGRSIPERVAEIARCQPDRIALTYPGHHWSYGQLEKRAGELAGQLSELGAGPERVVAVCLDRSPDWVASLYAVLKTGGAFLSIDPAYPEERLRFLLRDTAAPVLVTVRRFSDRFGAENGCRQLLLDAESSEAMGSDGRTFEPVAVPPDGLAYTIYTSGSTGRPKGVEISHRGFRHLVEWRQRRYGITHAERAAQVSGVAFDGIIFELWPFLTVGATLVLPDEETRIDAAAFRDWVIAERVTVAFQPSPMAEVLLRLPWPRQLPLRSLQTGGDTVHRHPPAGLEFGVYNNYGPTENTVITTSGVIPPVARDEDDSTPPTVGRPIAHVTLHLLDAGLRPLPLGAIGELFAGGSSLGRGYRNHPARTAASFLPNPFSGEPGARLYRTGDLVRFRGDGELQFLGRNDHQVKLRGFRIELGEIEALLAGTPGVEACIVMLREDQPGQKHLVAYAALHGDNGHRPDGDALRRRLASHLPDYMVPKVMVLDALPLTPNGKVDRRALPAPAAASLDAAPAIESTPTQQLVAGMMADVLGQERLGPQAHFFDAGGHSLLGTQLVSRLREVFDVELPLRALFDSPTVAELAEEIERRRASRDPASSVPPLARRERGEPAPLSFAQERMWFLDRLDPGTPAYNMPFAVGLRGELDAAALTDSLGDVVQRHEILRTTFELRGDRPVQLAHPAVTGGLPWIDLAALDDDDRRAEARRIQHATAHQRFDLARGPLWIARLVRLEAGEHRLLLCFHHSIADGWSMAIFTRELVQLYRARTESSPTAGLHGELPVQYADYASWQREWLASTALDAEIEHWRRQLGTASHGVDLLRGRPRPAVQTFRGGSRRQDLTAELSERIRALTLETSTTLFMTFLTVLGVLLHRLSGRREILVGSPIAGRDEPLAEGLIGVFLNTLVMRLDVDREATFRQLLEQARTTALDAHAHQRLPFELLLQALQPHRDLSRTPFFQVFLNVLNLPAREMRLPDLVIESLGATGVASKFDLTLYVDDRPGGIRVNWVYNADLFSAEQIDEAVRQLELLLVELIDDPDQSALAPSLRTPAARRLLPDPAAPAAVPAWNGAVHTRFFQRAAEVPEQAAVIDDRGPWSYGELARASRRLSARLRAAGVGPGDVVAIHACRDASLVWALLGVLDAGAAFLVLDASYPAARLAACWRAARPKGLLRLAGAEPWPDTIELDDLDLDLALPARPADDWGPEIDPAQPPGPEIDPDGLAYLAFTSGSTGKPKGIRGSHRPLAHFLDWSGETFVFTREDRFSLLAGLAHDPLLRDVFTPLVTGATLLVPPAGWRRDPAALAAWMRREKVTVSHLSPALGRLLLASGEAAPPLRLAFFGGDSLPVGTARQLASWSGARVINFYGATETPQAIAWRDVGDELHETVPIGRGIDGVDLLVVNPHGEPAGVGERGEIWVRTPYLSLGYLGGEEPAGRRFAPNPFTGDPADRVYRTGDAGCYLEDGSVLYLGRDDDQVSLRGYRVEPGEVAAALLRHPRVEEAAVVSFSGPEGDDRLAAYHAASGDVTPEELRGHVARLVPDYMVPSAWVPMEALPRTPAGKLDRRALPDPTTAPDQQKDDAPEPRDGFELGLSEIFQEVLGHDSVRVTDDFFALGGHSLLVVALLERTRERFGRRLPITAFFQTPTVERLAELLREIPRGEGRRSPVVALEPGGSRTPFFCVHALGGSVLPYRELARALGGDQPVYGLEASPGGPEDLAAMAAEYRRGIREVQPRGPYALGGWSMGGTVAFEIARQLAAEGEKVARLVLIDAFAPGHEARREATIGELRAAFVHDLATLGGAEDPGALSELARTDGERAFARLLADLQARRRLPASLDAAFLEQRFEMFRAHREALRTYRPEAPLACPAVVFEAAERRGDSTPGEGWDRYLIPPPRVEEIPGDHYSLLRQPHVATWTPRLAAFLDGPGQIPISSGLDEPPRHPFRETTGD